MRAWIRAEKGDRRKLLSMVVTGMELAVALGGWQ